MDHCDGSFESKCCCCVFLFGFFCFCPIARKDETYNFSPVFFYGILVKRKLFYFVFIINYFLFCLNAHRVPAHRIVLSASSAYFAAMFMGSLRESKEEEITLVDVLGEPLQLLIQYCYTGTIELREDNVEILLATACLLQLSPVVNACCNFLAKQLHPSNCLGTCTFFVIFFFQNFSCFFFFV